MQINTSYNSAAASAMQGMFGSQNMDDMDSTLSSEIMKAKDADSSGSLTASELGISSDQLGTVDTDGDGQISSAELTAALKAKREKMQAQMSTQMQQSGQMGMLQASMGNGQQPDEGEMASKIASDIISDKDTNKDGVLSAEELGVSSDKLSSVDTDGDGSVSSTELAASLKADHEKRVAEGGGKMQHSGGAHGAGQKPSTDQLISSLFDDSDDGTSTSSTTSASTDSTSSSTSLAEFLKKQKASNAYLNMDRLITDLFGGSDAASQAVSASA